MSLVNKDFKKFIIFLFSNILLKLIEISFLNILIYIFYLIYLIYDQNKNKNCTFIYFIKGILYADKYYYYIFYLKTGFLDEIIFNKNNFIIKKIKIL